MQENSELSREPLPAWKGVIERAVRPIRASREIKRKMREELLAQAVSMYSQALLTTDPRTALETVQSHVDAAAQLMELNIPAMDSLERIVDWATYQPGESCWIRGLRYAGFLLGYGLLFVLFLGFLKGYRPELPMDLLGYLGLVALGTAIAVMAATYLEQWIRLRLLQNQASSWGWPIFLVGLANLLPGLAIVYFNPGRGTPLLEGMGLLIVINGILITAIACVARVFHQRDKHHHEWETLVIN